MGPKSHREWGISFALPFHWADDGIVVVRGTGGTMEAILTRLEGKIDGIATQLDSVNGRLDNIDTRLDAMDGRFDAMDSRFDGMDARFDAMDGRLDGMDSRFDEVNTQLGSLDGRVTNLSETVHKQGVRIEETNDHVKLVAEGVVGPRESVDRGFAAVMARLDERVQPVEAASRYLAAQLPPTKRRRK